MEQNLTVSRTEMLAAVRWYEGELFKTWSFKFMTPANVERIKKDLANLQRQQVRKEINKVWHVPVQVVILDFTKFAVEPLLDGVTLV